MSFADKRYAQKLGEAQAIADMVEAMETLRKLKDMESDRTQFTTMREQLGYMSALAERLHDTYLARKNKTLKV
jgi:exosome complex RNA-binding protein Csl4